MVLSHIWRSFTVSYLAKTWYTSSTSSRVVIASDAFVAALHLEIWPIATAPPNEN